MELGGGSFVYAAMSSLVSRRGLHKLASLARFLYLQRIKGFDPPETPLMDDASGAWLAERLKSTKLYLEFGSGGSTVLANRLGVPSVTVESDRFYATAVRKILPSPRKARIITPKMGVTREWGMPLLGKARKGPRYVHAPFDQLKGTFPDLVLVDGRYRVACVLETARQAAEAHCKATVMLDDYEDRANYRVLEKHLGKPKRIGRAATFLVGERSIPEDTVLSHIGNPS